MTAAEFLTHFGEVANAPGGVARLREMIFSMAVRGHLVPHDFQLPAIFAGRDFKPTDEDEILDAEKYIPMLPENWTWARFEWLGEIHGGLTPSMSRSEFWDGDIPWVSPKDMHTDVIRGSEMRVTAKALDQTSLKLVPSGSILFVTRSGILRRTLPVALTEVTCVVNQDLKVEPSSFSWTAKVG
ncbi:MAG: restriction endonuclease subunit S [Verrucomicrobiaceae bacterium]|mgnify:CR=1 FL=1